MARHARCTESAQDKAAIQHFTKNGEHADDKTEQRKHVLREVGVDS